MPELNAAPLRDCQIRAIQGIESSLAQNKPRALIQMATGSGKTFMAVTTAYRLIKFAGAKRILFLVDRGNLGRQTVNEFQQFDTPDDGRKFTDLYNVQLLGPAGINPVCQVTVSTIQRLYSQLMGQDLDEEADEHSLNEIAVSDDTQREVRYNPAIPIESFDFIIIDECHRSIYNLWKQVLDYFDAFLIGLTATPSKATLGFFNQNLVTEYPHVQAVADGVNVGYDIYRIKTEITEAGGKLECKADYQRRDRLTRAKRWALQDEDEAYDKTRLDRSVVAVNQIREVLQVFKDKLFTELFPDRPAKAAALGLDAPWVPKTLIFAKDDSHAEDIVKIAREVFGKGNDFCKKVTYKAGARPEEIIKAFRTDPAFRIAVTVDMIATGTDIKPLECLLFMRDVRSQLYFEQMKGRGTRTIDPTDLAVVTPDAGAKSRFILVDAVGVTETDKTDSRPIERKPTVPFDKLMLQIAMGKRDEATLNSLANRLARLDRALSNEARAELKAVGGISVKQLASNLIKATDPDAILLAAKGGADNLDKPTAAECEAAALELANKAVAPIANQPAFRELLEQARRDTEVIIDHISRDKLLSADYDYERAEQLITSWKKFLDEHQDEITALQILYNKPHAKRHLTYDEIKHLADTVSKPPYHLAPDEVWKAYEHLERRPHTANTVKTLTNLITLVRHAINPEQSPLHPFPEIVETRYQQWLPQQQNVAEASRLSSSEEDQRQDASATLAPRFTEKQLHWLGIIKNYVALNGAFNTDDSEAYLEAWQSVDSDESVPFAVAKRAFGKDPKPIIEELNEVLVA